MLVPINNQVITTSECQNEENMMFRIYLISLFSNLIRNLKREHSAKRVEIDASKKTTTTKICFGGFWLWSISNFRCLSTVEHFWNWMLLLTKNRIGLMNKNESMNVDTMFWTGFCIVLYCSERKITKKRERKTWNYEEEGKNWYSKSNCVVNRI